MAQTIGPILDAVARLNKRNGLIDQVIVVDADSADGTAEIARANGAEVYSENELLPAYGPSQGKGDAMWRSLSVAPATLSCSPIPIPGISVSILFTVRSDRCSRPGVQFSKAAYRRPFLQDGQSVADGAAG